MCPYSYSFYYFQAEDGIRDESVTGVQTCALPICCSGTWTTRSVTGMPGSRRSAAACARSRPLRRPRTCLPIPDRLRRVALVPVPPFVLQLRRGIGHDRLFLTGVTAVVLREDLGSTPSVLYGRRSDNGLWALPSGIVEPGEQPATSAVREVEEELRVGVEPERLALVTTDPELTYPNGDVSQYVSLTFRCRYVSGEAGVGD